MNTDEYLIKVKCFGGKGLDLYYAGLGQLVASPFSQMDQWFTVASCFVFAPRFVMHICIRHLYACVYMCASVYCICVYVCVYAH